MLAFRRDGRSPTEVPGLSDMRQWEAFYNPRRRHSALDYLSPTDFERRYRSQTITAA